MDEQQIRLLWQRYLKGQISPAENRQLFAYLSQFQYQDLAGELLEIAFDEQQDEGTLDADRQKELLAAIFKQTAPANSIHYWPRIAAVASIILFIGIGIYFLGRKSGHHVEQVMNNSTNDLVPGSNRATLILAGGKHILLSDAKNGQLAVQVGAIVQKTADGEISYKSKSRPNSNLAVYNTMSTPRGGQFHLILSDGTVVILDASSSITYPVRFVGTKRKVEVTGQVYFEVVHDPKHPFEVLAKGQTIHDVGTAFNVNAYDDEVDVMTTLIKGAVTISTENSPTVLLKPGQQAITEADNKVAIHSVDTRWVVAWKNGYFSFKGADTKELLRQLARWYDVDIVFQGDLPKNDFAGSISRNIRASKVFEILKNYGIRCVMSGKTMVVSKE